MIVVDLSNSVMSIHSLGRIGASFTRLNSFKVPEDIEQKYVQMYRSKLGYILGLLMLLSILYIIF
jgi:hypothetical protein